MNLTSAVEFLAEVAMVAEVHENNDWVPLTPAKLSQDPASLVSEKQDAAGDCELGKSNCSGVCFDKGHENTEQSAGKVYSSSVTNDFEDVVPGNCSERVGSLDLRQNSEYYNVGFAGAASIQFEETPKANSSTHCNIEMDPTIIEPSGVPINPTPKKTSSRGVNLNKKRRPKVKRHRPKVNDESKPKKISKSRINPTTPKQKTPSRAIHNTSSFAKKNFVEKKNVSEMADGSFRHATYFCRKRLNFNLENHAEEEKGHGTFCENEEEAGDKVIKISFQKDGNSQMEDGFPLPVNESNIRVHAAEPISDHTANLFSDYESYVQVRENSLEGMQFNEVNGSSNYQNSKKLKESNEETVKLDFGFNLEMENFECCSGIRKIIQQRTKSESKLQGDFNLLYYERMFRPNECQKNARKIGPKFPKIFKKPRMKRKRATVFGNVFCDRKGDILVRGKGTFHEQGLSRRSVKKRLKEVSSRALSGHKFLKRVRDWSFGPKSKKCNTNGSQPSLGHRIETIDVDQEALVCFRSLLLMQDFRKKKRSATHHRKKKCWVTNFLTKKETAKEIDSIQPHENDAFSTSQVRCKIKRSKTITQRRNLLSFGMASKSMCRKTVSVSTQCMEHKKAEDRLDIHVAHAEHLNTLCLVEAPVFSGQNSCLTILNGDKKSPIDCICQQFEKLRIFYDSSKQLVVRDPKYSGALLVPKKRRKMLAKIDLDDETIRAWKFLMENDGSEGIGQVDEDTEKWWEYQREIFRGRIDSFISCMHCIQGDRRFSPWKGSVVDSVVGVFLTQNVSDHLSSSAFMSLAARFPPPLLSKQRDFSKNSASCKKYVDDKETECRPSSDGGTKQPFSSSSELNMEQSCTYSTTKSIEEDEIIYNDAVQSIQDSCPEIPTSISGICSNENSSTFRKILQLEEDDFLQKFCDHGAVLSISDVSSHESSTTISRLSQVEIFATIRDVSQEKKTEFSHKCCIHKEGKITCNESINNMTFGNAVLGNADTPSRESSTTITSDVLEAEETVFLRKICSHENVKRICEESISDEKFGNTPKYGDAVVGISVDSSCESLTTIARLSQVEDYAITKDILEVEETEYLHKICSHEEDKIEFGAVLGVPNASYHDSFASIAGLSQFDDSAVIRDVLQEENESLQKFCIHEEDKITCDENKSDVKIEDSHCMTDDSRSDKTFDLEGTIMSSSPLSQNLVADIRNSTSEGSHHGKQQQESTGGRKQRETKERQEIPAKWDDLRKKYSCNRPKDAMDGNLDSVNWEAVRQASIEEVAKAIVERGMNNILAGRIKDFLDRMVEDHGTIDLEWLRNVPPLESKNYLLSILGLGLKSTECVRLLTLRHHAFPVDTNVGRILVRLGWVPLLPLPEDVQIHLLNQYPLVDTIQKYIWPRLSSFSKETLYECHYQMITFGKVFCTKRQPNCNACPMRGQCRHFASAYASSRLRLCGQQKSEESEHREVSSQDLMVKNQPLLVHFDDKISGVENQCSPIQPIVEFPPSPEPDSREILDQDMEDFGRDIEDEIPTIKLNQEEFKKNVLEFIEKTIFLRGEEAMSKVLVALDPTSVSIPMPKLKFVGRLRTVHQVYELPDSHPLLAGFKKREPDDPCPYLLAIWMNENAVDVGPGCSRETIQEHNDESIQGTILIPCRTANSGSFPLNGTYFQVNEVFADHESSRCPIAVPRKWIWNLCRRSLYCGTSTTSIFRGMTIDEIQYCFWRGFICVRGADRETKAPRPLARRFHICKSRQVELRGLSNTFS